MRQYKVATRYAKSILDLSLEMNLLEEVYNDMMLIFNTCEDSKELLLLLKNPIIKKDKKETILNLIFGKRIGKLSHSFIHILTVKGRENLLGEIAKNFIKLYKKHEKIETAQVISAIQLPQNIKSDISNLVKNYTQSNEVELKETVDPDIIGGLILKIEDQQLDNSIKRKLDDLKALFSNNLYVKEF